MSEMAQMRGIRPKMIKFMKNTFKKVQKWAIKPAGPGNRDDWGNKKPSKHCCFKGF